jgi:hypothetical protein
MALIAWTLSEGLSALFPVGGCENVACDGTLTLECMGVAHRWFDGSSMVARVSADDYD